MLLNSAYHHVIRLANCHDVRPVYYHLQAKFTVLLQCLETESILKQLVERGSGKNYSHCLMVYRWIPKEYCML